MVVKVRPRRRLPQEQAYRASGANWLVLSRPPARPGNRRPPSYPSLWFLRVTRRFLPQRADAPRTRACAPLTSSVLLPQRFSAGGEGADRRMRGRCLPCPCLYPGLVAASPRCASPCRSAAEVRLTPERMTWIHAEARRRGADGEEPLSPRTPRLRVSLFSSKHVPPHVAGFCVHVIVNRGSPGVLRCYTVRAHVAPSAQRCYTAVQRCCAREKRCRASGEAFLPRQ